MSNKRWVAIVLILLGAASYGILSPMIKLAFKAGWNGGEISSSQITMGMMITWLLVLIRRKSWSNPFRGPWIKLSLIGIGLALTNIMYNNALTKLDASLAIVLLFQFTWMTLVMDSIVNRRWPSRVQMLAVLIVMIGTSFAVNIFAADWSQISLSGVLLGLASALGYSLFLFFIGRIEGKMDSLMKSAIMLTAALIPIYLIYSPQVLFVEGMGSLILWGLLLGTLGQVGPTLFFNIGIPRVGSTVAALLGSLELPVGLLGALLIVGESVLTVQWFGMMLIMIGIAISELKFKSKVTLHYSYK
jgi:drug/metabolite transporter (DMT)-like permease